MIANKLIVNEVDVEAKVDELSANIDAKMNPIEIFRTTTATTTSIATSTVTTLGSLALSAGTYIIFATVSISGQTTTTDQIVQCCLSTSTSYDHAHSKSQGVNGAAADMQVFRYLSVTSSTAIYLLGYQGGGASETVSNVSITALKIA